MIGMSLTSVAMARVPPALDGGEAIPRPHRTQLYHHDESRYRPKLQKFLMIYLDWVLRPHYSTQYAPFTRKALSHGHGHRIVHHRQRRLHDGHRRPAGAGHS